MELIDLVLAKSASLAREYEKTQSLLLAPEITADKKEVKRLSQKRARLEDICSLRGLLAQENAFMEECENTLSNTKDGELRAFLEQEKTGLEKRLNALSVSLASLLIDGGEKAACIRVQVMGEESEESAFILKAYRKYAERAGYQATLEKGVLCVFNCPLSLMQTLSATHKIKGKDCDTSLLLVAYPYQAAAPVTIDKKDVRTDIFLSHGKGGQNINKVETAVRLTYLPLNIVITCQDERSQLENKKRAYERLTDALRALKERECDDANESARANAQKSAQTNTRTIDFKAERVTDKRAQTQLSLQSFTEGDLFALTAEILLQNERLR